MLLPMPPIASISMIGSAAPAQSRNSVNSWARPWNVVLTGYDG